MAKVNYKKSEKTFINPYSFVDVDFDKSSKGIKSDENILTGYFDCRITTKTPLAIPDIANSNTKKGEHPKYDCMRNAEGIPIIRGSSIRGIIRSVYETSTNSCFSTISQNSFLTARSEEYFSAGLLIIENGEWVLYSADEYRFSTKDYKIATDNYGRYIIVDNGKSENYLYSGDTVLFNKIPAKKRNVKPFAVLSENGTSGVLVIGEKAPKKNHEKIFSKDKVVAVDKNILKNSMKGLEQTLDIYRDKSVNKNLEKEHHGYPAYERAKENGCIPIWYKQDGDRLYLSFASKGRVAYNTTINKMLNKLDSCASADDLCKACDLFGMIGKPSKSSRVRFTDALCVSENPCMGYYTLEELSSPKTSYIPFYARISSYSSKNPINYDDGLSIRGRKYYWHSDYNCHVFPEDNCKIQKNERNATINLIDCHKMFDFRVYFDRVPEGQLYELIWAINFWENDENGELCHKICHGKPLGLGSVKITVKSVFTREYKDGNYRIEELFIPFTDSTVPKYIRKNSKIVSQLQLVSKFSNRTVKYPFIDNCKNFKLSDNDVAGHVWFTENKNADFAGRDWETQLLPSMEKSDTEKLFAFGIYEAVFTKGSTYKAQIIKYNKKYDNYDIELKDENKRIISSNCSAYKNNFFCSTGDTVAITFIGKKVIDRDNKLLVFYNFKITKIVKRR